MIFEPLATTRAAQLGWLNTAMDLIATPFVRATYAATPADDPIWIAFALRFWIAAADPAE